MWQSSLTVKTPWLTEKWLGVLWSPCSSPFFFMLSVRRVSESCSVSDCIVVSWLYSPWNSPGQNTGVGSLSLLQGIFPTQGLHPGFPHCRWILYQLSHKGSPRILWWIAYPFSSRSSWSRNQTGVSCVAGGFFTNWIREALGVRRMLLFWGILCLVEPTSSKEKSCWIPYLNPKLTVNTENRGWICEVTSYLGWTFSVSIWKNSSLFVSWKWSTYLLALKPQGLGIWPVTLCLVTSVVSQLCATLWTVDHQAPQSMGFSRPRILEWVAMPSSRGSSQQGRDWTCVSCSGRRVLYH